MRRFLLLSEDPARVPITSCCYPLITWPRKRSWKVFDHMARFSSTKKKVSTIMTPPACANHEMYEISGAVFAPEISGTLRSYQGAIPGPEIRVRKGDTVPSRPGSGPARPQSCLSRSNAGPSRSNPDASRSNPDASRSEPGPSRSKPGPSRSEPGPSRSEPGPARSGSSLCGEAR